MLHLGSCLYWKCSILMGSCISRKCGILMFLFMNSETEVFWFLYDWCVAIQGWANQSSKIHVLSLIKMFILAQYKHWGGKWRDCLHVYFLGVSGDLPQGIWDICMSTHHPKNRLQFQIDLYDNNKNWTEIFLWSIMILFLIKT